MKIYWNGNFFEITTDELLKGIRKSGHYYINVTVSALLFYIQFFSQFSAEFFYLGVNWA